MPMTTAGMPAPPRAFVSYSWTSPTHESWVLGLASRLREDGVDVILDKWDLKPGHDAYAFMESMVTDPTVGKVMMVCDRAYVEKADRRSGGVGAESQIISPEIYRESAQDKFAALITEEDAAGEAFVPVFYKGRIYFDFRSGDRFEDGYERLLRWLVDRPMHVKPKLGTTPGFILEGRPVATATQSRAARAEEAGRQGSTSAAALIREYGDALVDEVRALAPLEVEDEPSDEAVVRSVQAMRPYVRQFTELVATVVRFTSDDRRTWEKILYVQERLGMLMHRDPEVTRWHSHQFDAYKIVAHETFLTIIALALEEERFDLAEAALRRPWLVREQDGGTYRATSDHSVFREHVESLDYRNQRLKLNRTSLQADMLRDAHPRGSVPDFEALMQADLVLFLRGAAETAYNNWYPLTLAYAARRSSPFPLFARSESEAYFARIAPVLGVTSKDQLRDRIAEMNRTGMTRSLFGSWGLPVGSLANVAHLGVLD